MCDGDLCEGKGRFQGQLTRKREKGSRGEAPGAGGGLRKPSPSETSAPAGAHTAAPFRKIPDFPETAKPTNKEKASVHQSIQQTEPAVSARKATLPVCYRVLWMYCPLVLHDAGRCGNGALCCFLFWRWSDCLNDRRSFKGVMVFAPNPTNRTGSVLKESNAAGSVIVYYGCTALWYYMMQADVGMVHFVVFSFGVGRTV